ncbi:MAG: hypothetical protein SFX72_06450 [Isosphaeraceae bacterium]|jgi:hypothetical protein|nr:hypothetical protein [Isosphaeraceae bacterium]
MSDAIPSLWSKGLESDQPAPISVLRSQIAPIKELTKGLIEGEILTWSGGDGFIYYLFDLVAPKLNLSRHCIMAVSHAETRLYPVTVQSAGLVDPNQAGRAVPEVGAESSGSWSIHFIRDRAGDSEWPRAKNGKELMAIVSKVFQSESVAALIQTIVARSLKGEKVGV